MKCYIDKHEEYEAGADKPFTYTQIDYIKVLKEDLLFSIVSRNLMIITDEGKMYYSCLLTPEPKLRFFNKERMKEQMNSYLPINHDLHKQDYCEVSKEFVIKRLEDMNKRSPHLGNKNQYTAMIKKIEKLN